MDGVHQDGEEGAEEDEENRGFVGDAEPDDGERDPGDRRDGAEDLERGFGEGFEQARPADTDAEADADVGLAHVRVDPGHDVLP